MNNDKPNKSNKSRSHPNPGESEKPNLSLTNEQKKRNDSDGNSNVGDSNEFNTEKSRRGADQTEESKDSTL